jgi:hypothetical protein
VVSRVAHKIEDESVVVFLRQVLGHVVGDIFFSGDVYQVELVLAYSVPEIADMVPLTRVDWFLLPRKKMQPTTERAFDRDR